MLFGVLCCSAVRAQQQTHFGLWSESRFLYNPAYHGMGEKFRLVGNYRSQWTGVSGHPQTYLVGLGTDIPVLRSGVGMVLERDQTGNRNFNTLTLQYNYRLINREDLKSRIGFSANLRSFSLNQANILTPEGTDGSFNDQLLEDYPGIVNLSQLGVGWVTSWKDFELGVSYLQGITAGFNRSNSYEAEPELFIRTAYNFTLNNTFTIRPYSVFYSNFILNQLYAAVELDWNNRILLGIGMRSLLENAEALTLSIGSQVTRDVLLRYQYEIALSGIAAASQGSHELIVFYEMDWTLGKWKEQPPIYSPRTY
ncbi:MAG TPA: PorP/SprF family type IX secretion system membrane protein [Saprospiraceae bacterium]|nr:PorP/SprF family type IX secretion system membrane protein [Saprospiraceae bacterium]